MRFFVFLLCLFFIYPAQSKLYDSGTAKKHAQKIIDACYQISEDDRGSGVTSRMLDGSYNTIDCLEKKIKAMSKLYLNNEKAIEKFNDSLSNIIKNQFIMVRLYSQNHIGCHPCGTQTHLYAAGHVMWYLNDAIENMMIEAYEYPETYKALHDFE